MDGEDALSGRKRVSRRIDGLEAGSVAESGVVVAVAPRFDRTQGAGTGARVTARIEPRFVLAKWFFDAHGCARHVATGSRSRRRKDRVGKVQSAIIDRTARRIKTRLSATHKAYVQCFRSSHGGDKRHSVRFVSSKVRIG